VSKVYYGESGYVQLLKDVLENGVEIPDRTGIGCRAIFDAKVVYDKLGDGETDFALSSLRSCPPRFSFEEMWMFLKGETDTKTLEDKGIYFWAGNTSREFLDSRDLCHLPEGDLGRAYSEQWRDFGGYYTYARQGVDQLLKLIDTLGSDRYSRRMVVSLWNPSEEDLMPLTPCWWASEYVVLPNKEGKDVLHVKLINRSLDVLFGFPFAVQQYRLFQLALCKMFGFEMGTLSADLSHVHLYNNQLEYAQETVQREFGEHGKVLINKEISSLGDLLSLQWEDILVTDLEINKTPFRTPKPSMAI
jgi:thymidylate synthase